MKHGRQRYAVRPETENKASPRLKLVLSDGAFEDNDHLEFGFCEVYLSIIQGLLTEAMQ